MCQRRKFSREFKVGQFGSFVTQFGRGRPDAGGAALEFADLVAVSATNAQRQAQHKRRARPTQGGSQLRVACGERADLAICRRVGVKPRKAEGDCFGFGAKSAFIATYIHVVYDGVSESGLAF